MKIYKISILFILLMIFSVGFVFAEDVNQTDANLKTADSDVVVSAGENKTYTNLADDIDTVTNLTSDYAYNNESDMTKIIEINARELTINGNNHSIDGADMAGAFLFEGKSNVTINDLTFKNCDRCAIGISEGSKVTLNNVKFINNNEEEEGSSIYCFEGVVNVNNALFENNSALTGGTIYAVKSEVNINDSLFKNNYGGTGGAIYAVNSEVNINDSLFKNNDGETGGAIFTVNSILGLSNATFTNKNPLTWSFVYALNTTVLVENSTFANSTSKYATALFSKFSRMIITGSKFENLYANVTAGAIGVKTLMKLANPDYASLIIQDCIFSNVTSQKDAGAVYADVNGGGEGNDLVLINNTLFEECSSEFAGAVMQLGGRLTLLNSTFQNNMAYYCGGALYLSNVSSEFQGCKFLNNFVYFDDSNSKGGALFLDYGRYKVQFCNFTLNSANVGGGIYAFDSFLEVTNSSFDGNGEGIHGFFLKEDSFYDVISTNDTFNMTDEDYPTYVFFTGKKIVLDPIEVTGSVNDTFFDLRKFGAVTPVQNQGSMGACWAFATIGAFESAFKKATNVTLTISSNNMQNSGLRYSIYGKPELTEGGYIFSGLGYILSWLGVLNIEYDSYDELGKISPIIFTENNYHVQDALIINTSNRTVMKDALIKYGALTVFVEGAVANNMYYNPKTNASYCNESLGNHFVTIVGWNDTFSKDNFLIDPGEDGAWIVKNSWGTGWGDEGYFYLSYFDVPIRRVPGVAYVLNNTSDVYDKLYQYDIACFEKFYSNDQKTKVIYKNTFENVDASLIGAVGTYFENKSQDYRITVYVNGNKVHTQEGKSKFSGFESIRLTKQIAVGDGQKFAVEIETQSAPLLGTTRGYYENGTSILIDGNDSLDLSAIRNIAVIKAYAFNDTNNIAPAAQYYLNKTVINCSLEGAEITASQDGKVIASANVTGGKAVFDTPLKSGNYTITIKYNGTEILSILEIYPSITCDKNAKVAYNSKLPISFSFVDVEGKPIVNAKITGLVDSRQVTLGVTDKNGKIALTASGLKLSVGTHTLTVVNPVTGEKAAETVKVVSRFSSVKNIVMFYFDGTSFKVRVYNDAGNPVAKAKVTVTLKGKKYTRTSDSKGYITLKIPKTVTHGTYKLKATYAGQTITKTVKVKQVIKAKKTVTVKKSAKKLVYKVTLKGKKVLKKKTVTLKVKGKTLKAKTNKKGVAKFTISKKILKKLKAGKKYTIKVTYLKDTLKRTLKVKR